jgi:phage terminase small subunit
MDLNERIEDQAAELLRTLLDDLEARGLVLPVYIRKAEEYVNFWRQKAALDADVEERGVMVYDEKRKGLADNLAVSRGVQVANMMQAIFRDLGFRDIAIAAAKAADNGGEADDLLS